MFDYRGYGRSEGIPTLDGLLMDARAARQFLRGVLRSSPRRSCCSAVRSSGGRGSTRRENSSSGAHSGEHVHVAKRSGRAHYPAFLVNSLVKDRYDTQLVLPQLRCPILISHGDLDQTIPVMHAHRLHEVANEPKTLLTFPEGDHNSQQPDFYWDAMERFLESLPE
ncbi:MAG: alpha/beta hydrolase [Pirellulaceae bacterium]